MTDLTRRPGKSRPRLSPEERREQILRAAGPRFAEHGYSGTDVQDIADDIGVGKGTIYRHFATKETLFLATVQRAVESLSEHVALKVEPLPDPLDKLKGSVHAYLEFFDACPGVVELFIQERAAFGTEAQPLYFAHRDRERAKWQPLFDELVARGDLRPLAFRDMADTIGDALYGAAFAHRLTGGRCSLAERADAILDVILNGILKPGDRAAE